MLAMLLASSVYEAIAVVVEFAIASALAARCLPLHEGGVLPSMPGWKQRPALLRAFRFS